MKRLRILFFSATGNTKRAIEVIRGSCVSAGIEVEALGLFDPAALPISADVDAETLIAFPALGFGAPNMVQKRLRSLPEGAGAVVRALIVCGAEYKGGSIVRGWPGQALEQVESILKRRGYRVASTTYISYPSSWVQVSDPPSGVKRDELLAAGDAEARKLAAAAIVGESELYRCGAFNRLWSSAVNFLFRNIGRRFLGKCFAADESCTGCGLCAKSCPARSIVMRFGRPAWKASCEDCNRCINICPVEAIQLSGLKAVLYLGLSLAALAAAIAAGGSILASLFPDMGRAASAGLILAFVLALTPPIVAMILGPIDALVRLAGRMRPVGRLLSRGYTSRFGRYKEQGFRP
jgi:NAD-dependent dihydropyrimidine dehydrogenase PreA subunit